MKKCSFKAKVWKYKGASGWHFVTLPKSLSNKIRKIHGASEEGWGRLKAKATVGKTKWETSIWFDSKFGAYLLPMKSVIRKKENVEVNVPLKITLEFEAIDSKRLGWLVRK